MIWIYEDTPKKISGSSSLFLTFEFNQGIINILKSLDVYNFDKKTSTWEVPINSLSYLLDNLTYFDDIRFIPMDESKSASCGLKPSINYKTKPYKYQMDGITWGLNNPKGLLLDAPGLGKTLQIIYLAEELKKQKGIEHCFIICGINTLKTNWKKEIQKHSSETCRILGERKNSKGNITYATIEERAKELSEQIDEFFIISNIETFRDDRVIEAFNKSNNKIDMIVVDEIHRCKSKTSQQGHNLLKLNAPYKYALTGTLLLNNPLDCYVPLYWTENEHSNLTNFKKLYCNFGGFGGHQVIGFKNLDILKDEIDKCSLRRTKDLLDLPPKNIIEEYVDMSDSHRKFYDAIKKGVKEEADKIDLKTSSLLALVTRLRQATACPSLLTTQNINSSKIQRASEIVEDIVSTNEKVVVFSTFKESCSELQKLLKEYGIEAVIATGDTKDSEVSNIIDTFQKDDKTKVLIATWQKMGTGITLTRASYMIFLDTPWTYSVFEQCCDRIYRIGTSKTVYIYNLICTNTIDERVNSILKDKKAISDYVIDDTVANDEALSSLKKFIEEL